MPFWMKVVLKLASEIPSKLFGDSADWCRHADYPTLSASIDAVPENLGQIDQVLSYTASLLGMASI